MSPACNETLVTEFTLSPLDVLYHIENGEAFQSLLNRFKLAEPAPLACEKIKMM